MTTTTEQLAEALRSFVALCPSAEGLGGHAPIGAFITTGHKARAALARYDAERQAPASDAGAALDSPGDFECDCGHMIEPETECEWCGRDWEPCITDDERSNGPRR